MTDSTLAAYEAVPYESHPIPLTEIGSLESMARLHGMEPPSASACRVLELGCASGGNLIPMAYRFPRSHFVGVDLAPSQVEDGKRAIAALGLTNLELHATSIADITPELGTFDYVIAHGVYSWVPPLVQNALLRVCSQNLSANGVAYVSYNTYPGWHLRDIMRNMLLLHDDQSLSPTRRVERARALSDHFAVSTSDAETIYELVLAEQANAVRTTGDAHLLHEQLEPFNEPVYFTEFAQRAAGHGLRFVCESKVWASGWQSEERVTQVAGVEASDVVRMQQYTDLFRGRTFRSSLLCHASLAIKSSPSLSEIPKLYFVSRATTDSPSAEDRAKDPSVEAFRSREGTAMATNNAVLIAAMRALIRAAPRALNFPELLQSVEDRLAAGEVPGMPGPRSSDELATALAAALIACARGGLVDFDSHGSAFVSSVSARPRASLMTRRAAPTGVAPNLQHNRLAVGPVERVLLEHLDGTRTRDDLLDLLAASVADGTIPSGDAAPDRAALATAVDTILAQFASAAFLEA